MASVLDDPITTEMTVGDLFDRFGPIPLWRIVFDPAPGTATFDDVLARYYRTGRFCELVDGVMVEKDISFDASRMACLLAAPICQSAEARKLGVVSGEQEFIRLTTGNVRGPDVTFVKSDRFPGGRMPEEPLPALVPTLAVEVMSPGNTKREMANKLADYFRSGVELVWFVYPEQKQVVVFTSDEKITELGVTDTLDGGSVLPGFSLVLSKLFADPLVGHSPATSGK